MTQQEKLLLPQGKVKKLILEHTARTKKRKDFSAHYFYFLHTIRTRPYIDRRFDSSEYIPINYNILKGIISERQIRDIKRFLLRNNIIQCNNKYYKGEVSKGYKVNTAVTGKYWLYETITDKLLTKKLNMHRLDNHSQIRKKGKGYEIALYWLHEIEINYRKAYQYTHKFRAIDSEKYNAYSYSIKELKHRKYRSLIDDNKRMHHNLSNLASVFRKHLHISGERLGQIDIKNSQPLFLYLHLIDSKEVDRQELIKYGENCIKGQFYETLASEQNTKLNAHNRKEYKQKVFASIFFGKDYEVMSETEKAFNRLYPTIHAYMTKLKREQGYRVISEILQKSEADFIYKAITYIDKCTGYHKVPLLAIHDCIVTTESNLESVTELLKNYFVEQYVILPRLSTEAY